MSYLLSSLNKPSTFFFWTKPAEPSHLVSSNHVYEPCLPYLGVFTRGYFFLVTAAQITKHITTQRRDFFSTWQQPLLELLGDDPYKSVSVTQRRCSKRYPCLENSLWRHMLRAQSSQIGGKWADTVIPPNLFLSPRWDVAQWDATAFSLSVCKRPLSIGWTICPAARGYEPINTEICSLPS